MESVRMASPIPIITTNANESVFISVLFVEPASIILFEKILFIPIEIKEHVDSLHL